MAAKVRLIIIQLIIIYFFDKRLIQDPYNKDNILNINLLMTF